MNEQDHELAGKIVRQLNEGTGEIPAAARDRLEAARKLALSRYRAAPAAVGVLASAGNALTRFTGHHPAALRYALGTAALAAALIGITYWQANSRPANELAEIDTKILTDELPINAYLDKDFDSWLKRSSR
jgi:hypothetical protein